MAGSASPRKPKLRMSTRSELERSLLVAWRSSASSACSGVMPQPSSITRIARLPPSRTSTWMRRAPASTAFSTSSFTTEAGRSTTSPAAIWSTNASGSRSIRGRGMGRFSPLAQGVPWNLPWGQPGVDSQVH